MTRLRSVLVTLVFACGGDTSRSHEPVDARPTAGEPVAEAPRVPEPAATEDPALAALRAKVARFVPAELSADLTGLEPSERATLDELVLAARLLDPVFDRQAWAGNPGRAEALERAATDERGRLVFELFQIMRGPWDRQDRDAAFATDGAHPPGAGFYPEDATPAQLESWVETHPDQRAAFDSPYTVIVRQDAALVAVPYHEAYAEWLEPAAQHLERAAKLTSNASLRRFLRSRAQALRTDDYYRSDKDWMDVDSRIEITIGPYETYEDQLLGKKAAFEAFVTVADPEASAKLDVLKGYLPDMERNLPLPDHVKTERGTQSPIRVVDLVYSSGDARTSVQTIAFNLPNDERVRKEKGAKKVLLRNSIKTKFDSIMRPIGERIIDEQQLQYLSADAFFNEVLFHELSHSLGPAFTDRGGGEKVEVRVALGASFSALEEAKADAMGAWNILYMISRGEFPPAMREQLLVSYFAGLFRSVRFGVADAHGQAAALQINRFLQAGAASFDENSGRFTVNFDRLEEALAMLVGDICMLQHEGIAQAVEAMLAEGGKMSPPIERAIASLEGIPVDIRPIYPLASGR